MFQHFYRRAPRALGVILLGWGAQAADIATPAADQAGQLKPAGRPATPEVATASTEADLGLKRMRPAPGFKVDLFAAEPLLANPVAFCLDEKGRVFVSETYRYRTSVLDIRHYMFMLEDDLACRTVEDRQAMVEKHFGPKAKDLAVETEVIRLLEDRDKDGKADFSSVYADHFTTAMDGIASGVMARKGKVWFTNIPELWLLEGIDEKGQAKTRQSISHGYGVRFSYTGHDMHGLIFGPDGKVYFSFGDRAATVRTKEGKLLSYPDEGAVFRCNPDGTEMEMFAHGLRNPQELAFDDQGNLFTGDNDSDQGDVERWVYVVEGGDSGWRVGYQHAPLGKAGPWNMEKLWVPHFEGQAAYIVPAIANIGDGPSGLAYYPGTGLPSEYDKHFFLCYFKGSSAKSGIQSFALKPKGAGFELVDSKPFLWESQITDVDFGPDGKIYFSDWGEGWERTKKGRIYRTWHEEAIKDPIVAETQKLIGEGMDHRPASELVRLLGHRDRRVRQESQFSLVEKKEFSSLTAVAQKNPQPLARLHAIWGLGQLSRSGNKAVGKVLLSLLQENDAEVRAQAIKVLGEIKESSAFALLIEALRDPEPRVRFFAAQSLGKLGRKEATPALLALVRENQDQDQFLRHAAINGLVGCNDLAALEQAANDSSVSVRMAVLVALRRLERPEISRFLQDKNPALVLEAARAINDAPISNALPQLASLPVAGGAELLNLRIINANFRVGTELQAKTLASVANDAAVPQAMRAEALFALGHWSKPPQRDRIVGIYRPLAARDGAVAASAMSSTLPTLIKSSPADVQMAAMEAAQLLGIKEAGPHLLALLSDKQADGKVRTRALQTLEHLQDAHLDEAVHLASADSNEEVRKEGTRLKAKLHPGDASGDLESAMAKGSIAEQQSALATLGSMAGDKADTLLGVWVDKLVAGNLPKELQLDVLEAAAKRPSASFKSRLDQFTKAQPAEDTLAGFRDVLHGGNAELGKKIFFEKVEASCLRCHKVGNEGGEVGPALTDVGAKKPREYLLESIIKPNAQIAQGFENLVVTLKNGTSYAGQLKSESEKELVLNSPEDGVITVAKNNLQSRERGLSGMPDGMGEVLSKRDLRDLVEYLASQKQ